MMYVLILVCILLKVKKKNVNNGFFLTHILMCVREDTTSFECDRMRRVFIRVLLFVKDKMGLRFVVSDEGTIYKCTG